ncbi:MAG: sugar kinase [Chloroflexaceae bacterium]|nr:sugar kinase [Chloroflexaceae bacterium]
MAHRCDVIGVGIASWDTIGIVSRAPLMGAKQPLAGWIEAGGGPVPTALVTLQRLGMRGGLVSAVGDDRYGQHILDDLRREGVEIESVQVRPGQSHVAFALVEPDTGRRTIWWHNDRAVLQHIALDRAYLTTARALLLDTHIPEVALRAAHWMREANRLVMIDAERTSDQATALLPFCDAIIVSERFGREATGAEEPQQAAQALYEHYHALVVVTAGEQGSWCASRAGAFHTPAVTTVQVVDTTGAGDVFHGAFLYGLLQAWPLRVVARFASATAALKCRTFGGRAGIPCLDEVEALVRTEAPTGGGE